MIFVKGQLVQIPTNSDAVHRRACVMKKDSTVETVLDSSWILKSDAREIRAQKLTIMIHVAS